jgi:hypothetical protein
MFLFTNDRYSPYSYSILLIICLILFYKFSDIDIPKDLDIKNLSNIIITITSVFMSFL